jgi:CTP synthase
VPASPYRSTTGALAAIQHARESNTPFLGTCGGFQHAVLEFARNVLNIADAAHAELDPHSSTLFVAPLSCSHVEVTGHVRINEGTALHACYGRSDTVEGYHCNYGLNEAHRAELENAGLKFTAFADDDTVRAFELPSHTFYVGTLFQPERAALRDEVSPPLIGLVNAAAGNKGTPLGA